MYVCMYVSVHTYIYMYIDLYVHVSFEDAWAKYGTMEPDCAAAIREGSKQLGSLAGRTFAVRPGLHGRSALRF